MYELCIFKYNLHVLLPVLNCLLILCRSASKFPPPVLTRVDPEAHSSSWFFGSDNDVCVKCQ